MSHQGNKANKSMLKKARVVKREGDTLFLLVEEDSKSCQGCFLNKRCDNKLLKLNTLIPDIKEGEHVFIDFDSKRFVLASFLLFLLPAFLFVLGAYIFKNKFLFYGIFPILIYIVSMGYLLKRWSFFSVRKLDRSYKEVV